MTLERVYGPLPSHPNTYYVGTGALKGPLGAYYLGTWGARHCWRSANAADRRSASLHSAGNEEGLGIRVLNPHNSRSMALGLVKKLGHHVDSIPTLNKVRSISLGYAWVHKVQTWLQLLGTWVLALELPGLQRLLGTWVLALELLSLQL